MSRSIGVEEELFLVDPRTCEPLDRSSEALAADTAGPEADEDLDQELFLAQVETNSEPSETGEQLLAHVRRGRARAADDAAAVGAALLVSPTSVVGAVRRLTPTDRYRSMAERHPDLLDRAAVCGMHVHIGVDDAHEAVRAMDRIAPWLPVVTALTAGSPFEDGRDTGYASWRAHQWDQWPTAGPTEPFGSLATYERSVADLVESGAALDAGMVYLDARPGGHTPTVEVRIADVLADPAEAVAVALLVRALVETCLEDPVHDWRVERLRAARWLAQRHGLGDVLLDPRSGRSVPAAQACAALFDHVSPALVDAGDLEHVGSAVESLVGDGGPAARARRIADGDPGRWARHLLEHGG